MSANSSSHLEWLESKLDGFEDKLAEAEDIVARLRPIVANLRGTIQALTAESQGPKPPKALFDLAENGSQPTGHATGRPFTVGNKNPAMPERRPEFAESTLLDAAGKIITGSADAVHANGVTDAVFEIRDQKGFNLAKHSVSSEMHRGAKKGFWLKVGPNLYRRR